MTTRTLTNTGHPVQLLTAGATYLLRLSLVGPDGKVRPIMTDAATQFGHIDVSDGDLTAGIFSVDLPVNDDTVPESHYRVQQWMTWTDDDGEERVNYDDGYGYVPAGIGDLQWNEFYTSRIGDECEAGGDQ